MPSLIGNKPNQVPSNGDLGTMAFREQDQFYNTQQSLGFKNRIINGAMMIDQRNAGASVTPTASAYTLDRWRAGLSVSSKYSVQQSSTAPTGFSNSLLVTSLSAYSVGASETFVLQQQIEGFNTADLMWGTANAQSVTLSFWVRSSLTGTFGGCFANSASDRAYPFTYTISTANTWEQKSVTVTGDTSGTWVGATNGAGLRLYFNLGSGSTVSATAGAWTSGFFVSATGATSVVGTNGATFYITGVQLEKGSTATSFDYRPYGTELNLCQRYLPVISAGGYNGNGSCSATNRAYALFSLPVTPRVAPTGIVSTAVSTFTVDDFTTGVTATGVLFAAATPNYALVRFDTASVLTQYRPIIINFGGSGSIQFTGCEL
jgi:hypothetical protein